MVARRWPWLIGAMRARLLGRGSAGLLAAIAGRPTLTR
jgi:hypothetical protein